MRVVAAAQPDLLPSEIESETILLTRAQLDYVAELSHGLNPRMPMAFGGAHVIRTLLERIEEADIDLRDAKSEEDVTRIAATNLRWQSRRNR
jgi:hypothetical protein